MARYTVVDTVTTIDGTSAGRFTVVDLSRNTGPVGPAGETGAAGPQGDPGVGVPTGGTTGQALVKASNDDYDTEWGAGGGGGGGVTDHGALTGLTDDDHTHYGHEVLSLSAFESLVASSGLVSGRLYAVLDSLDVLLVLAISSTEYVQAGYVVGTTGSLLTGVSGTPTTLAVGADGHVLTADSVESAGLKWAAPLASGVTATTTNFAGLLSTADTTVQAALDTLDNTDVAELARDAVGTALTEGEGIDITVSDVGNTITVAAEDASDSNKGIVELATTAEARTGTDTSRAVTAAGVAEHARAHSLYLWQTCR